MGKASKKMKRKNQQQKNIAAVQQGKHYAQEMDAHLAQGEYAEALDALAGMIEAKNIQPDYIYKGAYCYFMQGDYEKASQWVSNTLYYDANHIDARLLLARICFMEERESDMLAILERVLVHGGADLTEEQQETIHSLANPSIAVDAVLFPQVAAFCQHDLPADETAEKVDNPKEESEEAEKIVEAEQEATQKADDKIAEILAQSISLREKVQLLNRFAGAAFIANDLKTAYKMLKAALEIDDKEAASIRNMAMLLAVQGEKDKALELAASLPETDFVLLQQIVRG